MADPGELMRRLTRRSGIRYLVLVPNLQGLERAMACGVEEVAVFGAESEAFSQRNINCSINESLDRFSPVVERALEAGLRIRGYVSCVPGCPYEGQVDPAAFAGVAGRLAAMGCYKVSLGDTIGAGTPLAARRMLERVAQTVPVGSLAVHFPDTHGQALANIHACLELAVSVADGSVEVMNKASCLSLLSNAVLVWNTVHIARIVGQLRAAGHEVRDEDLARVSPLAHAHVIPNGSYFQSPRRRNEALPEPVMA